MIKFCLYLAGVLIFLTRWRHDRFCVPGIIFKHTYGYFVWFIPDFFKDTYAHL